MKSIFAFTTILLLLFSCKESREVEMARRSLIYANEIMDIEITKLNTILYREYHENPRRLGPYKKLADSVNYVKSKMLRQISRLSEDKISDYMLEMIDSLINIKPDYREFIEKTESSEIETSMIGSSILDSLHAISIILRNSYDLLNSIYADISGSCGGFSRITFVVLPNKEKGDGYIDLVLNHHLCRHSHFIELDSIVAEKRLLPSDTVIASPPAKLVLGPIKITEKPLSEFHLKGKLILIENQGALDTFNINFDTHWPPQEEDLIY